MTSFQRQVNLYGFRRLTSGVDRTGYYHEYFLRGRPDLMKKIARIRVKGIGCKLAPSPDTEPNFYEFTTCHENICFEADGPDLLKKVMAAPSVEGLKKPKQDEAKSNENLQENSRGFSYLESKRREHIAFSQTFMGNESQPSQDWPAFSSSLVNQLRQNRLDMFDTNTLDKTVNLPDKSNGNLSLLLLPNPSTPDVMSSRYLQAFQPSQGEDILTPLPCTSHGYLREFQDDIISLLGAPSSSNFDLDMFFVSL